MEVVDGIHAEQSQWGWSHVKRCRNIFVVRGDTRMTPGHTTVQTRSSGFGRTGIGQFSWKGDNMGCHEKAPVRYPFSRLATLHDAPWRSAAVTVVSQAEYFASPHLDRRPIKRF